MRRCFLCGRSGRMELHHIFGGALRKKSDRMGLVVDLCPACHNQPPNGAHFNPAVMQQLHTYGQRLAMYQNNWTKQDFIREFGKNYMED